MPRDANGTYTLPIAPFQPLTLAKSAEMNAALSDIADALTDSQSRALPTPAQGDLNMNGHNILNLGEVVGDVVASGGVFANGISSQFGFALEGPNYVWHWGPAGYLDYLSGTSGMRYWRAAGTDVMTLDPSGNLHANGTISAGGAISTPSNISATGNASIGGTVTANIVNANGITSYGNLTVSGTVSAGTVTASGAVTGNGITSSGALSVAGSANITGTLNVVGTIQSNHAVVAYLASGQGGFVGSWQGSSSNVGFVNSNNTIVWGNADGSGSWIGPNRMTLDPNGNLSVTGGATISGGAFVAPSAAISGAVTAGSITASGAATVGGNVSCNAVFAPNGHFVGASGDTGFGMFVGGGSNLLRWTASGWGISWDTASGNTNFTEGSGLVLAQVSGAGDFVVVYGQAYKPGGGSWVATSDDRVKRNVAPYQSGLAEILALRPISYEYNGEGGTVDNGRTYVGLSAQATRDVMPEMVFEISDEDAASPGLSARLPGQLGLDPSALTYALVRAVQELSAQVAALEAKVAAGPLRRRAAKAR